MTPDPERRGPAEPGGTLARRAEVTVRVVGGLLLTALAWPMSRLLRVFLQARVDDPGSSPNGYVFAFTPLFVIPGLLLMVLGAVLAAPQRLRVRALLIGLGVWALLTALIVVLLATMPPYVPPGGVPEG